MMLLSVLRSGLLPALTQSWTTLPREQGSNFNVPASPSKPQKAVELVSSCIT